MKTPFRAVFREEFAIDAALSLHHCKNPSKGQHISIVVKSNPFPVLCSSHSTTSEPPWRQPRGNLMVSLVNSHTNATKIGWHLWEIDSRFAPGLPPGWSQGAEAGTSRAVPFPWEGSRQNRNTRRIPGQREPHPGRVLPLPNTSTVCLLPSQGAGAGTGRAVPPAPPRTAPPAKVDRMTLSPKLTE